MGRISDFFHELKKRHVYRVAIAYGVVAWVVVEAASIVVPELMLPAWLTRAIIIVALLGFPIALVLAWAYDLTPSGVQRTGSDEAARSAPVAAQPAATGRRSIVLPALIGVGVVLIGVGVIGTFALARGGGRVPRGDALLAELDSLADQGRYAEAFELAGHAGQKGEAVPDSVAARFTDHLTILSEPAGAAVRVLRFVRGAGAGDDGWVEIGRTPIRGVAMARGDYLMRIAADGHEAVERIASSARGRSINTERAGAEVQLDVRLLPAGRVPAGMVHVPAGLYRVASRDLQFLSAALDDFFIDRVEVTNGAFAEFVDAGGYTRAEYWQELAAAAGVDVQAVRRRFTDRTGMPGPRAWSGQQPARGMESHPVTGVSWYEAAAYCRFRRARLPTLFEWEKAARDGNVAQSQGIELPWGYVGARDPATDRANFAGSGTVPVGSYPWGLSAYGALDMAGNAKEWLRNRSESGRAVTGGSWGDPIYVFSQVGSIDPASASSSIGFRCARAAYAERDNDADDRPLRLAVETPTYRPVDDATFRMLLSHYEYDPRALDPVVEQRSEMPAWTVERITYNGPADERVIAYLFLPRTARAPYQTMVLVPSTAAFFGNNVAALAEEELGPLVRAGRALFTVVMKGMTEREYAPDYEWPRPNSVAFRDQMVTHATELRLGLDYLATRNDIDMGALAYVGSSWGAGSRLLFAATDDRFRATVLIGAGIDERVHPTLPEASNINFAPRIRGPKLVVNGREDEEHPWLTRALPLWNLLAEPKELKLFDRVGHWPPAELRIPAVREFLDRHLSATATRESR
jgi:formylglycine-generating enzyme required for sulfatase activity